MLWDYLFTFAAVKQEKGRHIASWLLLAVFLPMLLLSSFHFHENHVSEQTECTECVAHHCHGHFSQLSDSMHHCVLCQFLTLTFVAGSVCAVVFLFHVSRILHARPLCGHCSDRCGIIVTRGPPACIG